MKMPLISLCIVAFNAEQHIAATLESIIPILNESESELVFVNDGSTDATATIALSTLGKIDQKKVTIIEQENLGTAVARNRAIREANGEWIYFLDADDLVITNNLLIAIRKIINVDVEVVRTDWIDLEEFSENLILTEIGSDKMKELYVSTRSLSDKQKFLRERGFWRYFYRTSVLREREQVFYPTFKEAGGRYILDDYYFLLEIANRIDAFLNLEIVTYLYRDRKEGISSNYLKQIRHEGKVWSQFVMSKYGEGDLNVFFCEELYRRFRYISSILFESRMKDQSRFSLLALYLVLTRGAKTNLRRLIFIALYFLRFFKI